MPLILKRIQTEWPSWLVVSFFALLPFGRAPEIPLSIFALALPFVLPITFWMLKLEKTLVEFSRLSTSVSNTIFSEYISNFLSHFLRWTGSSELMPWQIMLTIASNVLSLFILRAISGTSASVILSRANSRCLMD